MELYRKVIHKLNIERVKGSKQDMQTAIHCSLHPCDYWSA